MIEIGVNALHLDPHKIHLSEARKTSLEHSKAQKISALSKDVFAQFAGGNDVLAGDLITALVEGMHADVTRSGTSSMRRTQAGPLLRLYHAVVDAVNTAEARRSTYDRETFYAEQGIKVDALEADPIPAHVKTPADYAAWTATGDVRDNAGAAQALLDHLLQIGALDALLPQIESFRAGWEAAQS